MPKPLSQKLGIVTDKASLILNSPKNYHQFIDMSVVDTSPLQNRYHFIQSFVFAPADLEQMVFIYRSYLDKDGMLWICWPKKSAKSGSVLHKFMIRDYFLEAGLVDVKVASINEYWSGLKFVYFLKDRKRIK